VFGRISRSALPEGPTIQWLFDVYTWLLSETGGYSTFRERAKLVLPTDAFFPISRDLQGDALAQALFAATREQAGMAAVSCELVAHEEVPTASDLFGNLPHEYSRSGAAGAFHGASAGSGLISYAPSGLADPESFVATMAHELGHFLIRGFEEPPPGGDEAQEPATDVCAIFLGFGVFTANAAFKFEQFQSGTTQGWRTRRLGYLGERPLSYALAIFLALLGLDLQATTGTLRGNPHGYVKNALLHLARERAEEFARLKAT
jgi:hypothetical protein